jgi:hypothetical protein
MPPAGRCFLRVGQPRDHRAHLLIPAAAHHPVTMAHQIEARKATTAIGTEGASTVARVVGQELMDLGRVWAASLEEVATVRMLPSAVGRVRGRLPPLLEAGAVKPRHLARGAQKLRPLAKAVHVVAALAGKVSHLAPASAALRQILGVGHPKDSSVARIGRHLRAHLMAVLSKTPASVVRLEHNRLLPDRR